MTKITHESFKKFCETNPVAIKPKKNITKADVVMFFAKHSTKIEFVTRVSKMAKDFYEKPNPIAIVNGAFELTKYALVDSNNSAYSFFSETNGWHSIESDFGYFPKVIIATLLKEFQSKSIGATYNRQEISIVTTPVGQIGFIDSRWDHFFAYRFEEVSAQDVIEFLMQRKMEHINSNFIKFDKQFTGEKFETILEPMEFRDSDSALATQCMKSLTFCRENNIPRALLFNGAPGSGKSTLAHTILHRLNYRTLSFDFKVFERPIVLFLIKYLHIDALLINDADQVGADNKILDFLEDVRPHIKLIIATSNTLSKFHPAVIRPGRFDEIMEVNTLDESTVKHVLGELAEEFFEKTKEFPMAFLQELVVRSKIFPDDLEKHYQELNQRVKEQLTALGKVEAKELAPTTVEVK